MSSMYTVSYPAQILSLKMAFIIAWNVAGELVRPKNMTVSSNSPSFVTKAAFHISKVSFDLKYLEKGLFAFKRPQRQLRQYRQDFGKKNVDLD